MHVCILTWETFLLKLWWRLSFLICCICFVDFTPKNHISEYILKKNLFFGIFAPFSLSNTKFGPKHKENCILTVSAVFLFPDGFFGRSRNQSLFGSYFLKIDDAAIAFESSQMLLLQIEKRCRLLQGSLPEQQKFLCILIKSNFKGSCFTMYSMRAFIKSTKGMNEWIGFLFLSVSQLQ